MADSAAVAPARVVGIGASAGGLEAFTALLRHFELDSMAFVVIQHLAPDQPSILPELLERVTPMKVVTATHGARVLTNHVYIIPPGKALRIEDDVLQLAPFDETNRARPTIDIFFRSLAEDLRSRAAGVVLSGNGSDGTLGLKEIKDAGGITFVQDPATAQFDGMPRSAIDKGVADYVLPPREIAKELMRLSKHPDTRFPAEDAAPQREGLTRLFAMMRHAFGVNLAYYKPSTLERRVSRRMVLQKVDTLDEYVTYLERTPEELDVLYRDLLIGVTNFFRDGTPFDALKTAVFPLMMADKRLGDAIRIWSPGCSTGEEVYSLAIALLELLGPTSADYKIQIFGTDLDETAIQFARRGVYHESITLDVSADRLQRFFTRHGATYQVNRRVRDLIVFSSQDLTHDAPFSHLDVVSCRNVLIYLQPEVQKRVLRIFHYALAPSGFMLLGSSETVGDASELFTVVDRGNKIFGKRSVVPHGPLELAFVSSRNNGRNEPALVGLRRPLANIQQLADRKVLERYGP
ncbi:MAG TPA: chemotaxis protein CheB, partial [Myxococcota bacterium]|nr:chemotaxis protein CheB [Myxococcota bacterium]